MTIEELGSLGEFVGSLAVLVTLVYLALQTRQARLASEETAKFASLQATHAIVNLYVDARRSLMAHSEILAKANAGEALSTAEQGVMSVIFHDLFYAAAYSYASAAAAGSVHSEEGDIEYFTILLKQNPSAIAQWHRLKNNVAKMGTGFVERVDAALG